MPKSRKKIDYKNYHLHKKQIEDTYDEVYIQFEKNAIENGWKDGKSKTYAFMKNYNSYCKNEKLEYKGD